MGSKVVDRRRADCLERPCSGSRTARSGGGAVSLPRMNKLRLGLIGYGAWGSHHARAIAEAGNTELVAIAARSAETQAAARAKHPGVHVCGDWRELLTRGEIDAVDVVLPTDLHYEV